MKRTSLLICIFCLYISAMAQETASGYDSNKKYTLTTVNSDIGITSIKILDNYLSPLEYDGFGLRLQTERRKFFSPEKINLSQQGKIDLTIGITRNPAQNASITYLAVDFAWGMHYHFRPARRLQLLAGGLLNGNIGSKINSRNVNNPFNIDFYSDIDISALAIWDVRRNIRLQASFDMPAIGVMFVPKMGETYYEMFDLGNFSDVAHFSSFHNKIGIKQKYSVFFTLKRSTLSLNYTNNYLKYKANDMIFKNIQSTLSIGWSYNLRTFAGKKNEAPQNFIKY